MSQKFKFSILTGDNAQDKYDAIANKEPFTFYLLQTGVGYLGTKKLFDGSSLNSENTTTLTGKFFRGVKSHMITQADLDNENLSKPEGTKVGDTGIIFTSDNNNEDDGDEEYFFIPISINTTDAIDPENPGDAVPTATAVVAYVMSMLEDKVSFEVDGEAGIESADGGISFPSLYSEEEVRIGTWIDGKPLYRRVFTGTKPLQLTQWTQCYTINDLDTCVHLYGTALHPGISTYIAIPDTNIELGITGADNGTPNNIVIYIINNTYANVPMTIIAEYTKTTD